MEETTAVIKIKPDEDEDMVEEYISTAIATFNPQSEQALIALHEQSQGLLRFAEALVIKEVKDLIAEKLVAPPIILRGVE